ncbi:hypothetical protein CALCODRAFT_188640 [Calocera cornea HHB12733]|uniref:Uncharacterized protein n=1 Tax=Calocera cornea HHB12733 TaxID=1353952 RepID=A0A165C9F5_9BASI|nr:hypothetical protein CALCODRAFT_188640 [Calocera cornea HHB12733]
MTPREGCGVEGTDLSITHARGHLSPLQASLEPPRYHPDDCLPPVVRASNMSKEPVSSPRQLLTKEWSITAGRLEEALSAVKKAEKVGLDPETLTAFYVRIEDLSDRAMHSPVPSDATVTYNNYVNVIKSVGTRVANLVVEVELAVAKKRLSAVKKAAAAARLAAFTTPERRTPESSPPAYQH